jgi:hypothetical protein
VNVFEIFECFHTPSRLALAGTTQGSRFITVHRVAKFDAFQTT